MTETTHYLPDLYQPPNNEAILEEKFARGHRIAIVIPTLNEDATIGTILSTIPMELIDEVVVIDSGSIDNTKIEVESKGIKFISAEEKLKELGIVNFKGKGTNMWLSQFVTTSDILVFLDGDMENPTPEMIYRLVSPLILDDTTSLAKSVFTRDTLVPGDPAVGGRLTKLTTGPVLNWLFPETNTILQILNGNIGIRRSLLEELSLYAEYGIDVQIAIETVLKHGINSVSQIDCGSFMQQGQSLESLERVAHKLMAVIFTLAQSYGRIALETPAPPTNFTQTSIRRTSVEAQIYSLEQPRLPLPGSFPSYNNRFKTQVVFIRHAPTTNNVEGRIQGQINTSIIDSDQSEFIARYRHLLRDVDPRDLIIATSELTRTQQTAQLLCAKLGWDNLPIISLPQFDERSFGILEGRTREEARDIYPDIDSQIDDPDFTPESGESLSTVATRTREGLARLRFLYPGRTILLITHAGVMISLGINPKTVGTIAVGRDFTTKLEP